MRLRASGLAAAGCPAETPPAPKAPPATDTNLGTPEAGSSTKKGAPVTPPAAPPAGADAALGQRLHALGFEPKVDGNGDYRLLFALDGGRQQVTYVRSHTERFGSLEIREIWSPGYQADGGSLPGEIANRLLQDGQENILGAWVRQDGVAVYVVRVPATLDGQALADAIEATTRAADAMEAELTPGKDEF